MQGNKGETKAWEPLLEPLSVLERSVGTLLEPHFCAGTPIGILVGTPFSALEPLMEPTFVRFCSFLEIQHGVWPFTT